MRTSELDDLKRKLPLIPEIQGRQDFFNSAVIVPIVEINDALHLLFEKRAADIRQPSEICFPGGKYDPETDKSYQDTAIRETVEELGVASSDIEIIGRLNTLITPMGVIVETFPALINLHHTDQLNINKKEVEKVFTVPIADFQKKQPEFYKVRVEIQPNITKQNGEQSVLFPAKQLNIPEKYHKPWGGNRMRILVYQEAGETIWGITAEIIYNLTQLLKN